MLSNTEWTATALGAAFCALVIVLGFMHTDYFSKPLIPKGNAHHLRKRCVTAECMEAAAWLMGNMDESVDACENFYDRACGNYANQHPFKSDETETTVLSNMREKNRQRLQEIISSKPVRYQWGHMYDVVSKVNNYYQACINQLERSKRYTVRNNPVVPIIKEQLGTAWWVNDPSRVAEFDWQAAMRATAKDRNFVFFQLLPLPKARDVSKYVLEVGADPSPTFSWRNRFGLRPSTKTNIFRSFLVSLGTFLARDNGANTSDSAVVGRINQFADDVINVTARFNAPIRWAQLLGRNSGRFHRTFNFSSFKNQENNGYVQWESLIDAYSDGKFGVRSSTTIVEHFNIPLVKGTRSYSSWVSRLLKNFNQTDASFARKMNNYFAFRIAFYWMPDLNYEYNHLYQMYLAIFHGVSQFPDDWEICMDYADFAMPKTLGALYVSKFYRSSEEQTVSDVSMAVRQSLTDEVSKLTWMDEDTKKAALNKLSKVTFKIGKPKSWVDDNAIANEMSTVYGSVDISSTDHFANIKALINVLRLQEIRQLTRGSTPYDHWRTELYDTRIQYYGRWNEVLLPAGLLQEPLVSPKYPAYMNFGGLGSWIASILLNAIDEEGQVFDANYAKVNWWSQPTWDKYNPKRQSVIDFYEHIVPPDIKKHVNTTTYARFAIAETGGLRQAYKAYKRYAAAKNLNEKALPSLAHGNTDQMFFYSYASTHCADYTARTYHWRTIYGQVMPEYLHVNGGVALMKEFRQAFQCPAGTEMIIPEIDGVPFIF